MSTSTQPPFSASQPQNVVAQDSMHHSDDSSYLPVIIVLAVITVLSIASCIVGRICSRGWNNQVSRDLEKGLDAGKADTTRMKNKEATSSRIKPKMTTPTPKCELHGNKTNRKKFVAAKDTASTMSKKQALTRCELHGVYLSRQNNASDLSGANDEEQNSIYSN